MSDPVASLSAFVRKLNRLDGFVSERASRTVPFFVIPPALERYDLVFIGTQPI